MRHVPVLLKEAIRSLDIKSGGVYIDGTFGAGGYSREVLSQNPRTRVIAIDRDPTAIQAGQDLVREFSPRLRLIEGRFGDLANLISQPVDGIVLDIGVSSMQIDQPERGFSFQKDGTLDMRMGHSDLSAADVVNTFKAEDIADILFRYGEERHARRIAQKIVESRQHTPFRTTLQLAECIHSVMPHKKGDIDSATRTFQALRIYVNDELGELERVLQASLPLLKTGGRLSVVTFHSLEDRIVKQFFKSVTEGKKHINKYAPAGTSEKPAFSILTPKPVTPSDEEIAQNPRARSAKLRTLVKNGGAE